MKKASNTLNRIIQKAERIWKKSKLTIHREIVKDKHKMLQDMRRSAKQKYYNRKISDNDKDSKELFKITNSLLYKEKNRSLPSHSSPLELANRFAGYFTEKISIIRQELCLNQDTSVLQQEKQSECVTYLESFVKISDSDVSKLILGGNSKSCNMDPIPTTLVKQLLSTLLPSITTIINKSITEGKMPRSLKKAVVTPLLKKSSLPKENLKNFRPVSNLAFIGKCIEKVAIKQMEKHLSDNNLNEPLQSAYKTNHSTETALIKVTNDILLALDKRLCTYLVLLDLSAAFDTIDHQVFLKQLQHEYGMGGGVVEWMSSYLTDREQRIVIDGTPSDKVDLHYGFPQGSCVGPFGFKLYTKQLTNIARKHGIEIHLYADDTQLYTSFKPEESEQALDSLEMCIEEIRIWMGKHYLKLNDSKTEFMIFGAPRDIDKVTGWTVTVGENEILPSSTARNIGAYLDPVLDLKCHVNNAVRACYFQLRSIARIRQYLSLDAIVKLCHAFITSRIDNLNSLLFKIPEYQLHKLQLVQNSVARLIKRLKRSDHITPALLELHWLPIPERIQYKILLLVYKCLIQKAPSYLTSMIHPYQPTRSLRSSSQHLLQEVKTSKRYGERAFAVCGPMLWNSLPLHIRQSDSVETFKCSLKTFLFRNAYNICD